MTDATQGCRTRHILFDANICTMVSTGKNVRSYISRYPVRRTVQSAIDLIPGSSRPHCNDSAKTIRSHIYLCM